MRLDKRVCNDKTALLSGNKRRFMTKKNWLLIAVAVALAATYVVFFTDWFRPATVQIFHTNRAGRARYQPPGSMPGLIFGLNQQLRLTDIKLVSLAAFQTNKNVLPLWHLVSDSNSVPVKSFFYGQPIRGLKPAIAGTRPQPLETNVTYRLFVEAGKIKGQHDFELK
jgi:hypothetical protein